ncbi:MAG: NADH-quinone oxidoreductase subunit N [Coriobacteriia bacterium]|nr:NADH-quinone oxidoreductase subunit N [Coriobacteriia bacterium]
MTGLYLKILSPEIIVALTGALILIADLFDPAASGRKTAAGSTAGEADGAAGRTDGSADGNARPAPRSALAWLGVAGLAVAAVAVALLHKYADSYSSVRICFGSRLGPCPLNATFLDGALVLDEFAVYLKYVFLAVGALALLLSVNALPRFTRHTAEYYALVIWCTAGNMLLASAGELFTAFLALQLSSLPLIVLIAFAKRDPRSTEAAMKYLLLVLVATAVMLYGITLIYGSLGTSTIAEIGNMLAEKAASHEPLSAALTIGFLMFLAGFAFKATAFPFHWWAPDVYSGAPSPVTAFLSVGSKFAGFALVMRIAAAAFFASHASADWSLIFGILAAASMIFGNLGAIKQTNIKRMLAYSGIAQAGYLLVGIAAASTGGTSATLFYIVAYGLANLLAFSVVIALINTRKSAEISDYAGMSRHSPLAAFCLTVALLSLGGLPMMAGFMAKFYVFLSAAESGLIWLVVIGVINSVIAIYYYLQVVWQIYVAEGSDSQVCVGRPDAVAMALCAVGVFAIGLFPEPALRAAERAALALFSWW